MANVDVRIKFVEGAAAASVSKFKSEVDGLNKGVNSLNLNLKSSSSFLKNFTANIASNAVTSLTRGVIALGGSALSSTRQLESLNTQFEVLTGSAQQANQFVQELVDFTARTPFRLEGVSASASRLLSFGFTTEEVKTQLQEIGDVAAASGADIGELSLIFGQVSAAGKLTGERLLQLQERAIPIGPALAKTLGVAESAVRDLVSEGEVSFEVFEKAFNSLNDTGEFAFEGMIKRSRTLDGLISTLEDNFSLISATLGQAVLPALKAIATSFIQLLQSFGSFIKSASGMNQVNESIIVFADQIAQVTGFLVNFGRVGVLAFDGIKIAASAIITSVSQVAESILSVTGSLGSLAGIDTSGIEKLRDEVRLFKETVAEDGAQRVFEFGKSVDTLGVDFERTNSAVNSFRNNLKQNFAEITEAGKIATDTQIQNNERLLASEEMKVNELTEKERRKLEEKLKLNEEQRKAEDELFLANQEAQLARDGVITEQEQLKLMQLADIRQSAREQELIAEQEQLGKTQELETLRTKIGADQAKRRTAIMVKENEIRRKENQATLSATSQLFGAMASLAAVGGKKLFNIQKALNLAQAVTSGVLAVQNALATPPYPVGITLAAAAAVQTAANVARISQQQPPSFQEGGIVPGNSFSGDNVVARVNSGEMILNRQQQARLFAQVNGGSFGGQQEIIVNTAIQLDGEVIGHAVSRQVANGLKLGDVV